MKVRHILAAATCMAVAVACQKEYKPDDIFINKDDIVLKISGKEIIKHDPLTFQTAYSSEQRQFRIHNDTMSEYFIVTCSALPTEEGQKLKCTLKYTTGSSTETMNVNFEVWKMDGDMVWLWCSKKNIGVTVKTLR